MTIIPSVSLASGPTPASLQEYIGAAPPPGTGLKVVADEGEAGQSVSKASGSGSCSFSSHYPKHLASVEAKNAKAKMKNEGGKRAEPVLARSSMPNEMKEYIVESFACFQSHTAVQAEILKRWGVKIDGRVLQTYDPRHRHCRLGKRLLDLYHAVREAYVKDTAAVAISHQAHRLRLVSRIVEKATTSKDYAAALKGLELAAKEMGGVLEGKSIVEHRGGVVHVHGSVEDARREVAMRLAQIVDGGTLALAAPPPDVPTDAPPPATHDTPQDAEISAVPTPPERTEGAGG